MAAIIDQTINVELTPGGAVSILHVSQGDYGLTALKFNIYKNAVPYSIPSSISRILLEGKREDGRVFSAVCSWSGNVVTAGLTNEMTAVKGYDICQIKFLNSSNQSVATANFFIIVEASPIESAFVDYSSIFDSTLAKSWAIGHTGQRSGENTDNAMYYSKLSESWAVGGTNTRAGENTNNSKYWANQVGEAAALISKHETDIQSMQGQIEQLIDPPAAHVDEVVNARIGKDGTKYNTLGEAIRAQTSVHNYNINSEEFAIDPEDGSRNGGVVSQLRHGIDIYKIKDSEARADVARLKVKAYDASDYDIFPDGTDVSSKVQDVLNQGISLKFRTGTYTFLKKVTVNKGVSIYGAGAQHTTLLWPSTASSAGLAISYEGAQNAVICDLSITTDTSDNMAISITETSQNHVQLSPNISNVNIYGTGGAGWKNGIALFNVSGAVITNCAINGNSNGWTEGSGNGIYIERKIDSQIVDFYLSNLLITQFFHAIYGYGPSRTFITSVETRSCVVGIVMRRQINGDGVASNLMVIGCIVNSQRFGINCNGLTDCMIIGNQFNMVPVKAWGYKEVYVVGIERTTVESGFVLPHRTFIIGNTITVGGSYAIPGPYLKFEGHHSVISNNVFSVRENNEATLIEIDEESYNVSIKDNVVRGTASRKLYLDHDTTGTHNLIKSDWFDIVTPSLGDNLVEVGKVYINPNADGVFVHAVIKSTASIPAQQILVNLPVKCAIQGINNIGVLAVNGVNVTVTGIYAEHGGNIKTQSTIGTGTTLYIDLFIPWDN